MVRTITRCVCLTALALAAAGCGESKRATTNVAGTVTFRGKPVPAGYINFMPDVSAGNSGEVKGFPIVDGQYDTSKGTNPGIYPGAMVIQISGFDGKVVSLWPHGKQIFNSVEIKETVQGGTKDIVVPESAGRNVQVVPTADPE